MPRPAARVRRWSPSITGRWPRGCPERPVAVVNVGGVANVTWIGRDGTLIAFDTGPGNALIDDWMLRHTGKAVDADGSAAASGKVDEAALIALLMNPYFGRLPPKSLDRNAFAIDPVLTLSVDDGAATLAAFTAASIARARAHFPEEPALWVICGGGRRNRTLMTMLAARRGERRGAGRGRRASTATRWRPRPGPTWRCARSRGCPSPSPAPPAWQRP